MPWSNVGTPAPPKRYICGFCGAVSGSDKAYVGTNITGAGRIYICTNCEQPSYFDGNGKQHPGVKLGNAVGHLPKEIGLLYDEARKCCSVNSYTAAVLCCRKLLMHVAVMQGAKPGDTFISYVEYLAANGYIPPNGKGWVDKIRTKGNEANHEIVLMNEPEASELLSFVEMLLKFVFEFPGRLLAKP